MSYNVLMMEDKDNNIHIHNTTRTEVLNGSNFDVMVDIKEKEQELQAKMEQKYKATLAETEHEVPLRTLYQVKMLANPVLRKFY